MLNHAVPSEYDDPLHAEIGALDNIFVSHSCLDKAIDGITNCISISRFSREPTGVFLKGEGGAGKTTVCRAILKRFPSANILLDGAIVRTVPAFYSSVPSPCSIKSLAGALLEELGDPDPECGDAKARTKRLVNLLKACRTRVIFLDEFHHLLPKNASSKATMEAIRDWLINLVNKSEVMICLVGTPACDSLISPRTELFRRFPKAFPMNDLTLGTKENPGELCSFLPQLAAEYARKIDLRSIPDFKNYGVARAMFNATSGRVSFITSLLKAAILISLTEESSRNLRMDHLAAAFDLDITKVVARVKVNPFGSSGRPGPVVKIKESLNVAG